MAKVYKVTDKVKVQVDDIVVSISPLKKHQKDHLKQFMIGASKGDLLAAMDAVFFAMKYSIKGVSGLTTENDEGEEVPYQLDLENGELTDECVNDLLNTQVGDKLGAVCSAFLGSVPASILGQDGKPLEGVKILPKVKKEGN